MTSKIFTPHVTHGVVGKRYMLYKRGDGLYSATPRGGTFRATVIPDICGLACQCGAYLTPIDRRGKALLAKAKMF